MSQKKTKYCCVCKSKVASSIKSLKFPKEESEREVWLNRLGLKSEKYKPYMRFCEIHLRADPSDSIINPENNDQVHNDHGQDLGEKALPTRKMIQTSEQLSNIQTNDAPEVEVLSDLRSPVSQQSVVTIHKSTPIRRSINSVSPSVEIPQEMELHEPSTSIPIRQSIYSDSSSVEMPKEMESPVQSNEHSQNPLTTPPHSNEGRPWLRYFGDVTMADVETPRGAKRALVLARDALSKAKKKIKTLEAQNLYLKKKVSTLSESLQEARNQHLLTEGTFATLKVRTTKTRT